MRINIISMKKLLNIYILFNILIILNLVFLAFPTQSLAEADWKMPDPEIRISDKLNFTNPTECGESYGNKVFCVPWIGNYINAIYQFAIGIVGILAVVTLMIGGVIWLTAGGNTSRVGEAKNWIGASISGLVIALASYMILYYVNPDLTIFKPIRVISIKEEAQPSAVGSCLWVGLKSNEKCNDYKENYEEKEGLCGQSGNKETFLEDWNKTGPAEGLPALILNEINPYTEVKCCCEMGGDWEYDPGFNISVQENDADPSLLTFLDCMKAILPKGVGRISSISDQDDSDGSLLVKCRDNYTKPPCEHTQRSCHYGGGMPGDAKSMAVDFGDENNAAALGSAAKTCDQNAWVHPESNHLHISIGKCQAD
jgi:hypothetical protein